MSNYRLISTVGVARHRHRLPEHHRASGHLLRIRQFALFTVSTGYRTSAAASSGLAAATPIALLAEAKVGVAAVAHPIAGSRLRVRVAHAAAASCVANFHCVILLMKQCSLSS